MTAEATSSFVREADVSAPKATSRVRTLGFLTLVVAIAALVAAVVSVRGGGAFPLPTPSGPFSVGTSVFRLPLARREAALGNEAVQIWFPTSATGGPSAPYAYQLDQSPRNRLIDAFVRTGSILDARIAPGSWPVVLYIPGIGGARSNNTALAQDLASFGYVVVGFNDERPANGGTVMTSRAAVARTMKWADHRLRLGSRDLSRAVDSLARANADRSGPLYGALALKHIAIMGFSFGGSLAAQFADDDPRVAAAINMGGWTFGDVVERGVRRPYLVVTSGRLRSFPIRANATDDSAGTAERDFNERNETSELAGLQANGGYALAIEGLGHFNLSDAALTPSLRGTGRGSVDPLRAYRTTATYVRTFVARYLKGSREGLPRSTSGAANIVLYTYDSMKGAR